MKERKKEMLVKMTLVIFLTVCSCLKLGFIYLQITNSCSPDNMDHVDNAASASGPPSRSRSAVTRRHKFDLAARTLLARAGKYTKRFPRSLLTW